MGAHTVDFDVPGFDQAIAKGGTVFVDFWASWCGPCRAFAPIYDAVAGKHPEVVFGKVDTEAHEAFSERFEIESIPTLMAFKEGALVYRQSGAMPAAAFEALVNRVGKIDAAKAKAAADARAKTARGERPDGLPANAEWNEEDAEWAAGPKDGEGHKHGQWKYWRADGTLCNECPYVHGQAHGPFKRFHESGEVSQAGQFVEGELHGTRTWTATEEFTTEQMHENGVSTKVRRTEIDYDHGRVAAIRHFDGANRRVLPTTGEPYPDRPKGVPDEAEFIETESHWAWVKVDGEGNRDGFCRFWKPDGSFEMEAQYDKGERHGPYASITQEGEFTLAGVTLIRGACEHDHAVGKWLFENAKKEVIASRELGLLQTEEQIADSTVLSSVSLPAEDWRAFAQKCLDEKHPGEAVLAFARATATDYDLKPLMQTLSRHALPRSYPAGAQVAASLADVEGFSPYVNSILRGGDPAQLLRGIAIQLDQGNRPRAALDFINAAILLAPERTSYLFTRGLVLMSLGLDRHAALDAQTLEKSEGDRGRFLDHYVQVLFPTFDFWAAKELPETTYTGLPDKPGQDLGAVQRVVQKYATRLQMLRARMLEFLKQGVSMRWLPPDLSHLLKEGPVDLDTEELEQEEGDPIAIDETLEIENSQLPDLLRIARADWHALNWLCWACGLSEVVMPKKLVPPKTFGQAAGMSAQRLWRCRDRRITGGQAARGQGAKGFFWEGIDIDSLEGPLVPIAEMQYAETQAMFYWLSDASNISPWQDNLRGS